MLGKPMKGDITMEDNTDLDYDLKKFLDAKHPLMERFRTIAPGTFSHSDNVSDLCEAVALEMGLDTDMMAVIGMYHDIGKINLPEAFGENQNGKNMHNDLPPEVSYQIITRHIGDTAVILLNEPDFPRKLIEMITQHHGNTVLRFFFNKSGVSSDELFRYRCKKPASIEAAVLMICDSVEATARSLASQGKLETTEEKRSVVSMTINNLMDDDQLDDIKVGQIKQIRKVLFKELENKYHRREAYPDVEKESSESLRINDNGDD